MPSYQVLEHTADIKIKVEGDTLPGLFNNALKAMADIMKPKTKKGAGRSAQPIALEAKDTTSLLIDFLNEALSFSHIHKEAYYSCTFEKISRTSLKGILHGWPCRRFSEEIKAVTYHQAKVVQNKKEWHTNIIFDV